VHADLFVMVDYQDAVWRSGALDATDLATADRHGEERLELGA
jgi:hypothetical protein